MDMRKIYFLLILTFAVSLITPRNLHADLMDLSPNITTEVILDGIRYGLYPDGKAHVEKCIVPKIHMDILSEVTKGGKTYVVTEIDPCAFFFFDHIDNVEVDSKVKTITLLNTLTKIGNGAFSGCRKLVSIEIPNSVTEIERGAFGRCYSLVSIVLPEGLTQIDEDTFRSCKNLKSIEIPASVEKIGKEAFSFCDNLETVRLLNPNTIIHENAFDASPKVKVVGWNGKTYNSKKVIKIFMVNGKRKCYSEENILNHFKSIEEAEACCIGEYEVE